MGVGIGRRMTAAIAELDKYSCVLSVSFTEAHEFEGISLMACADVGLIWALEYMGLGWCC
jgi:hypothetical protein